MNLKSTSFKKIKNEYAKFDFMCGEKMGFPSLENYFLKIRLQQRGYREKRKKKRKSHKQNVGKDSSKPRILISISKINLSTYSIPFA